jgi:serine/threonine-protein kinase
MTPARWRQIVALFEAAQRMEPAQRSEWLRLACGLDDDLRIEVGKLFAHEERLRQDASVEPPRAAQTDAPEIETNSRTDQPGAPGSPAPVTEPVPAGLSEVAPSGLTVGAGGFTPKTAIAPPAGEQPASESQSVSRQRLRALSMLYLGLTALGLLWRKLVLRNHDPVLTILNGAVMLALGWLIVRLSGRRPLAPGRLRAMELAMIGALAGMIAVSHYRNMLAHSLGDDATAARVVMQHTVVVTSILILTYGIYAPKSWLETAAVVTILAMLPYATLWVLQLRHPEVMIWLGRLPSGGWVTPFLFSGFDATFLLILAAGSTYGTAKINRLRRQVVAARRLGQYHLGPRIGAGGMGEVYMAEHQFLKRPCAIKLVHPDCEADPKVLERFEREVRLTATLSHWNTVEIYDYGRGEDGTYYYVMEYLPGLSLAEVVKRYGPFPPERVVYLLRQVCMALREAHAAGLVHRDIKPSNIIAARRGGLDDVAKLLDFGLVLPKSLDSGRRLTAHGQVVGTPTFMAPEQSRGGGRDVDARSDIYSMGAVAYALLTGRPPFDDDNPIEVMIAHARDPVLPPSRLRPDIPADLEHVVLRCLAKEPADRFPDAESLEHALAECACADRWNAKQAAQWWLQVGQPAAPKTLGAQT